GRAGGLDAEVRERDQRIVQRLNLERNVLDARLAALSEPLLSHLRVGDLDHLDVGAAALKEGGHELLALDLANRLEAESVSDQRARAFEAGDDHTHVVDAFDLHSGQLRVASS